MSIIETKGEGRRSAAMQKFLEQKENNLILHMEDLLSRAVSEKKIAFYKRKRDAAYARLAILILQRGL